jgi:hypothetical protein
MVVARFEGGGAEVDGGGVIVSRASGRGGSVLRGRG